MEKKFKSWLKFFILLIYYQFNFGFKAKGYFDSEIESIFSKYDTNNDRVIKGVEIVRLICDLKIAKKNLTNEYISFKKTHFDQNSNIEEFLYVNHLNYNLRFHLNLIIRINSDDGVSKERDNHYHSPRYMTKLCFNDVTERLNKIHSTFVNIAVKV